MRTRQTEVILVTSITGEFPSDEPNQKLCDYSGAAVCNRMGVILDDEGLKCTTESCGVTDASGPSLSIGMDRKIVKMEQSVSEPQPNPTPRSYPAF
jgi:hypothetical protein